MAEVEVAPRETTPPPLQAPTAKERKYDRQLRLWAASGQRALEESHVLLVVGDVEEGGSNSSVTGSEALKNLVLPSIGNFTVADSATVTEADLGVNFFLEAESLGKSRAEETTRLLKELNEDVEGHAISQKLEDWIPEPSSLRPYNLFIICGPVASQSLERICKYAQDSLVPVIFVRSSGFYFTFSIQLPSEFPVVDTHPDPDSTQDLRLLAPWPELSAEVCSLGDIKTLDDHDHGHIPYILLLLSYLEEWKSAHDGQPPSTFREKTQFRDLVRAGARTSNPEGGEENFDEACAAVLKTITPPTLGSGCRDMFQMSSCTNLTSKSANFWIIANAINAFYDKHGILPLPGSLPDMKARSSDYINLQNIYKSKARRDVAEVVATVRTTEFGLERSPGCNKIPDAEIEAFCKNASHIKVLLGTPLPQLRLSTIFSQQKEILSDPESDSLYPIFHALCQTISDPETASEYVDEVTRTRGSEMHNISSIAGGMVAQEAIKLLTRQYVPVDNTCIFDGIRTRCEVLKL